MIKWYRRKSLFGTEITIQAFGYEFSGRWRRYDISCYGSRAFLTAGVTRNKHDYSLLFQHYREGYTFDKHKDGISSNKAITLLLHRPKIGGEFYADGPIKKWLRGRIIAFNGGTQEHGVTKIEKGSRTVLMFQHGLLE